MRIHPRLHINIVLSIAAAGLGSWLWFTQPEPASQARLSTLDPQTIQHIRVQRPGKPDLIMELSGTQWRITAPLDARASQYRINSLIGLLQAPVISTLDLAPQSAGLADEPDVVSVTLDEQRFRFGDINPLDRSRYVEHAGTIYLIEDTLYPQLLQPADFFVEAQDTNATRR